MEKTVVQMFEKNDICEYLGVPKNAKLIPVFKKVASSKNSKNIQGKFIGILTKHIST